VWFGCALYPVLIVIAFRRQELHDLIDAVRATATKRSRRKTHRLADFEFVLVHKTSRLPSACGYSAPASQPRREPVSPKILSQKMPDAAAIAGQFSMVKGACGQRRTPRCEGLVRKSYAETGTARDCRSGLVTVCRSGKRTWWSQGPPSLIDAAWLFQAACNFPTDFPTPVSALARSGEFDSQCRRVRFPGT
jgi:hypothetical protein